MKIKGLNNLNFGEANKIITQYIEEKDFTEKDILDILNLNEKEISSIFLENYKKFNSKQLIVIEKFIQNNLNNANRDFVSDLIDFATAYGLNLNYNELISFLYFNPKEDSFVVLSTVKYISENIKLLYVDSIIKALEQILDNPNFYQNVQILAALCLFRITHKEEYLLEIRDWLIDDEHNKLLVENTLERDYYKRSYFSQRFRNTLFIFGS